MRNVLCYILMNSHICCSQWRLRFLAFPSENMKYPLQINTRAGLLGHSLHVIFSVCVMHWSTTNKLKHKQTRKIITSYPYDAGFFSNRKLEWLQVTCLKWSQEIPKDVFTATNQWYFESSSEWFIAFMVYDIPYPRFCRISNWSNCRSLFWICHVTLVKLLVFAK